MKGFVSTLSILLFFLVIFSLASIVSIKGTEFSDIATRNLILDKAYNKFITIEHGIERIIEEELNLANFSFSINENKFNLVTFNQTLPFFAGDFREDVIRFKNFSESKMNETNLALDLNLNIDICKPLTIIPYNISFGTKEQDTCKYGTGQRDLQIDSKGSWSLVNSYTMIFRVNGSTDPNSAHFAPPKDCKDGTLLWNITVIDNTSSNPIFNETRMIKPDGGCQFKINDVVGNKLQVNNDPNSILTVTLTPEFPIVSAYITLNLTDIPGRVAIGFPPQSIKVKETLYQIEKNDTVYIFGE